MVSSASSSSTSSFSSHHHQSQSGLSPSYSQHQSDSQSQLHRHASHTSSSSTSSSTLGSDTLSPSSTSTSSSPGPSFSSSSSSLGLGLSSSSLSSTMDSSTTSSSSCSLAPSPSSHTLNPNFNLNLPTTEPHRVLLLLDCQAGMLAAPPIGVPNAQSVRRNIEEVLEEARRARPMPLIVHMRNNGDVGEPDEPETAGWELVFRPKDDQSVSGSGGSGTGGTAGGELVIDKRKNNAFRGTPLGDLVPPTAEMVIVGFQTDHSIRATCQEGVKRGNEVLLIRGAHATHDRIEVLYGGGTTPASRIEGEVESELEDLGVHILDMKDLPGIFMDR